MALIFLLFSSFFSLLLYKLEYCIAGKLRQKYKNVNLIFWKLYYLEWSFDQFSGLTLLLVELTHFENGRIREMQNISEALVWKCFMNTYFNGVRPIFINWISVVQHIFSSGTSALLNLQMCCCWIKFTIPFSSSAQCTACVYLHFSWPVCPAPQRNPVPQWAHLIPSISLTSWQDQLISFPFIAVFYNITEINNPFHKSYWIKMSS